MDRDVPGRNAVPPLSDRDAGPVAASFSSRPRAVYRRPRSYPRRRTKERFAIDSTRPPKLFQTRRKSARRGNAFLRVTKFGDIFQFSRLLLRFLSGNCPGRYARLTREICSLLQSTFRKLRITWAGLLRNNNRENASRVILVVLSRRDYIRHDGNCRSTKSNSNFNFNERPPRRD